MYRDPQQTVFGISPLGGNSVEGTGAGMAEIRDTTIQGVPLFYDRRVNAYISELAISELDDRDTSLARNEEARKEEEFRTKAGIQRS
jgi:hypothetical protein